MEWLNVGIQFSIGYVQAVVQCVVENSVEVLRIGGELVTCAATKCFGG